MRLTYGAHERVRALWRRIVGHYGPSKYHRWPPRLVVIHDPRSDCYGWQWGPPSEVVLNLAHCTGWLDVSGTLIDEYQHHLQDPDDWTVGYEEAAAAVAARDARLFTSPANPTERKVTA